MKINSHVNKDNLTGRGVNIFLGIETLYLISNSNILSRDVKQVPPPTVSVTCSALPNRPVKHKQAHQKAENYPQQPVAPEYRHHVVALNLNYHVTKIPS